MQRREVEARPMVGSWTSGSEKEGENSREADEKSRSVSLLQLLIRRGQISRLTMVLLRVVVEGNETWMEVKKKKGCLMSPRGSGAEWKSGDVQDKAAPATV